ncbi:MAG: YidH family protein [Dermatophilaceae bacterium]
MSEQRRWPASVYGTGEEPDPRFSLANERTFLAWIRTALALLAGAAAVDALDLPMADRLQSVLAAMLAAGALLVAGSAWRTWAGTERAMRERHPLPSSPAMVVLVVVVAVVAVALAVTSLAG